MSMGFCLSVCLSPFEQAVEPLLPARTGRATPRRTLCHKGTSLHPIPRSYLSLKLCQAGRCRPRSGGAPLLPFEVVPTVRLPSIFWGSAAVTSPEHKRYSHVQTRVSLMEAQFPVSSIYLEDGVTKSHSRRSPEALCHPRPSTAIDRPMESIWTMSNRWVSSRIPPCLVPPPYLLSPSRPLSLSLSLL